jgi:hypothetical protein
MLLVVIPAYNEESGISTIIDRVLAIRPALWRSALEIGLESLGWASR